MSSLEPHAHGREPPVKPAAYPGMVEAVRQQTEFVGWIARALQDHEERLCHLASGGVAPTARCREGNGLLASSNVSLDTFRKLHGRPSSMLEPRDPQEHEHEQFANGTVVDSIEQNSVPLADKSALGSTTSAPEPVHDSIHDAFLEAFTKDVERRLIEFGNYVEAELNKLGNSQGASMDERIQAILPDIVDACLKERLEPVLAERLTKFEAEVKEVRLTSQSTDREANVQAFGLLCAPQPTAEGAVNQQPTTASTSAPSVGNALGGQSHRQLEPEIVDVIRSIHSDLTMRIPRIEDAVSDLKPIRLQIPLLQNDLETLSKSVAQLAQSMEEEDCMGNGRRGAADSGALSPSHMSNQCMSPCHKSDDVFSASDSNVDSSCAADEELGAMTGAHHNVAMHRNSIGQGTNLRAPQHVSEKRKVLQLGSLVTKYMTNQGGQRQSSAQADADTLGIIHKLEQRTGRLEEERAKFGDMEQLLAIIEDRVKELDADYRSHTKRVDSRLELIRIEQEQEEEKYTTRSQAWNLENQVDVIISVVAQEMKAAKVELDSMIKGMMLSHTGGKEAEHSNVPNQRSSPSPHRSPSRSRGSQSERGDRARSRSPDYLHSNLVEHSEKLSKLQENFQNATLKIAGLKAAGRHTEQLVTQATNKVKKIQSDLDTLFDHTLRNECRLDYMLLHINPMIEGGRPGDSRGVSSDAPPTFKGAIASGDALAGHGQGTHGGIKRRSIEAGSGGHLLSLARPQDEHRRTVKPRRMSSGLAESAVEQETFDAGPIQAEVSAGRIWRLGKKLSDFEGEFNTKFNTLQDVVDTMNQKITMFASFLPRRQRRQLERLLIKSDNDDSQEVAKKTDEKKMRVSFCNQPIECKTYTLEPDTHQVPWQCVGEPDQKWQWCLQPRSEMGRDLARYFEQLEHEREELEEQLNAMTGQLREELLRRLENVQYRTPGSPDGLRHVEFRCSSESSPRDRGGFDNVEKMHRRIEKAIVPQINTLEDRLERLVKDLQDIKKSHDIDNQRKVDKDDFQLIAMRLAVFDKFDPKQFSIKLENIEMEGKHSNNLIDQISQQIRKVEGIAAHRADLTKTRSEAATLKSELREVKGEVKEASSAVHSSNRQITTIVAEARNELEAAVQKLQSGKVDAGEYCLLQEKVMKLESSMRDNRQILSDSTGHEINHFVKRIILNMEDKLMVLEKKVECIAASNKVDLEDVNARIGVRPQMAASPNNPQQADASNESMLTSLGTDLSSMTQAVSQLRQDINLSKVDMAQIMEQGQQQQELAERLNVVVEDSSEEGGTELSLSRVQVMVAAAARQLVAGSKWITKETFDLRSAEMRKEYIGNFRQVNIQLEALQDTKEPRNDGSKRLPAVAVADKLTPRPVSVAGRGAGEQGDIAGWPAAGGTWDSALEKANARLVHMTGVKERTVNSAPSHLFTRRSLPGRQPVSARR